MYSHVEYKNDRHKWIQKEITKGCSEQIRITIRWEPKLQHPDAEGIYPIQSNIPVIYKHQSRDVYLTKHEVDNYWTVSYTKKEEITFSEMVNVIHYVHTCVQPNGDTLTNTAIS